MSNNINTLPSSGPISIQNIADAFYLYRAYTDGNIAAIDTYYGDLIKFGTPGPTDRLYYSPTTPNVPISITKRINMDSFHGKRMVIPINLTISSPVNNYNLYDQANTLCLAAFGVPLYTAGLPFVITLTNNSSIGSTSLSIAALVVGKSSDNTRSINSVTDVFINNNGSIIGKTDTTPRASYSGNGAFSVNGGSTSINYTLRGGGGGGGGGGAADGHAAYSAVGSPGGWGGYVSGSFSASCNNHISFNAGGGGTGCQYLYNGDPGGTSSVTCNSHTMASATGGGGGQLGSRGAGTSYSSPIYVKNVITNRSTIGGAPGGGGGHVDGNYANSVGGTGEAGSACISYQPNIAGGPGITLTVPTTIINKGSIASGTSSLGVIGGGYAILGNSYLKNGINGTVYGSLG